MPLAKTVLSGIYDESHRDGSNDFIYSRFLVPYLCNFSGVAVFIDGDMIVKKCITEVLDYIDQDLAVAVVPHQYKTKFSIKYLGNRNEDYPRKNWSSVIVWNCQHMKHRNLSPNTLRDMPGSYLHRFAWLDDEEIGNLPMEWNWLVDEYAHNDDANLLHYTVGIPAFKAYANGSHAREWFRELHLATNVDD